ncbi:Gfo/Idh/MocA family oxidoreductase [Caldilinea sp.]|uniref:Gfo/Idh/MocA family protein n=1 Tax=Caldilinea sp. TaxID=2293560 RepID=UPI002C084F41|nr:Gfo/Idh/MocA family oxidoreductase [Anaerolineales bacterium]HQY92522.1 Gfo/Idh/MocA family oxidoreductase [Caldilinea sp.]
MTKLRVAVIGAGGIGGTHLRAYAAWPEQCEVVGVADIDLELAQAKADLYAIPAFADYRTMLDECQSDAVSICTPPRLHLPIAQEVARRGIACLCEKPPARTVAETEAIVAAFEAAGVVLQFAFCHRFHEPVRQVQELIAAGKLGKPIQIYNRFGFRFDRAASSWFTDAEIAGGGVLIDTLVHSIDIFRALAGEIVRVDGAVSTTLPVQVEDSASLQVVSTSGVIGSLNCSWVTPVSEAEIRVWGTGGEAIIDYAADTGARYRLAGDNDWTVLPCELPDRFVLQAEHFLHCVHGNQRPRVSGADGIAVMRVIEAAYRSVQTN